MMYQVEAIDVDDNPIDSMKIHAGCKGEAVRIWFSLRNHYEAERCTLIQVTRIE